MKWNSFKASFLIFSNLFSSILPIVEAEATTEQLHIIHQQLERALITDANLFELRKTLYPYFKVQKTGIHIIICNEDFIVHNISETFTHKKDAFKCNDDKCIPNLLFCNATLKITENITCNSKHGFTMFTISAADDSSIAEENLNSYMKHFLQNVKTLDAILYSITELLVGRLFLPGNFDGFLDYSYISLSVDYFPVMPQESELLETMATLLTWVKFYIRTGKTAMESTRLDSDRSIVHICTLDNYDDQQRAIHQEMFTFSIENHKGFLIGIAISLNVAIMSVGLFAILQPSIVNFFKMESKNVKYFMFRSTLVVVVFANIAWLAVDVYLNVHNKLYWDLNVPSMIFFVIVEYIAVFLLSFRLIPCNSNHKIIVVVIIKLFQAYFICSILWFAHRIGNCLIVAIYFVAIAPSQASATLSLCSSIILTSIVTIAIGIYSCYSSSGSRYEIAYKISFKTTLFSVFLVSVSFVLILFTFLFVDLIQHGLPTSAIGTIILTLILPLLTFTITVWLKKYLKKDTQGQMDPNIYRLAQEILRLIERHSRADGSE